METKQNIFDYVVQEQTAYMLPVTILDDLDFNMRDHIKKTIFYKNSRFFKKHSDEKPFKNIIRPILNLQYRAEDIDVKDIVLYIDDKDKYYLSFLVKKYHDEVFTKENDLDTFFDELKEEKIDFGGALAKNVNGKLEVIPLQSLAFCDQMDILSAPLGIKLFYNPSELLEMDDKGWGEPANGATHTLEEAVTLANAWKKDAQGTQSRTTGNYIEVFEIHGVLPNRYLGEDNDKFSLQMQIIILDNTKRTKNGNKGVILYAKREKELPIKFVKRDRFYNRALGMGGAEELFGPQVWVNYGEIRMKEMLDAASKIILKTTDKGIVARHPTGVKDMDNLEFLVVDERKDVEQLDTYPRNLVPFVQWEQAMEEHAKSTGSAYDPTMGKEPVSGTPFASLQLQVQQGLSLHEYRKGKYAKSVEEIYRDWIIPYIVKEIVKGQEFLASLDLEELQKIGDNLAIIETNNFKINYILDNDGLAPTPEMVQVFEQQSRDNFKKKGNKHFIKILKDEMKGLPVRISINIVGKQKNLGAMTEKIVNIFRFVFSNPQGFMQIMQMPGMAKAWNEIIEYSGLSPMDFSGIEKFQFAPPPQPVGQELLPAGAMA
jgi:hypothetical protein